MMENTSKYRYGYIAPLDADVVEIPYSVKFDSYILISKLARRLFTKNSVPAYLSKIFVKCYIICLKKYERKTNFT